MASRTGRRRARHLASGIRTEDMSPGPMDPGLALLAPKPEDIADGPKLRAWSRGTGPTAQP